mgnify:CR=1 FL=1
MGALYQFNNVIAEALEGFLESAVPMIAGLAEVIGLFIIVTSLARATFHYIRAFFFHERFDFHHEMSSGLTTALEFLMSRRSPKRSCCRIWNRWCPWRLPSRCGR